jgi:hypothetical protein
VVPERGQLNVLSCAGVIELSLAGRGPKRAFVFDPHRLALPCWAEANAGAGPSVLVTLDRHFDTVEPVNRPSPGWSVTELETHARHQLDVRNYDHLLAAMEAQVISHAILVARAKPVGAVTGPQWVDGRGAVHELIAAKTVDELTHDEHGPSGSRAFEVLREARSVLLDVDLDCFTTLSDADPTAVVPWTKELIAQHVLPRGSEAFWSLVLSKCVGLTFAREPSHCGGLIASNRLFEVACEVIFQRLLETDLP